MKGPLPFDPYTIGACSPLLLAPNKSFRTKAVWLLACGALKNAHDLWNSNLFLIATERDLEKANQLLSGTI